MKRSPFRWLLHSVIAICVGTLSIIGLAPPSLYALGLSNVVGRPSPPASCHPTPTDRALLEHTLRMSQPIAVERLSPWAYVNFILEDDSRDVAAGGVAATSLVAQQYNAQHLKDRRSIAWHLSGAALTIWITRHWSADEVVCAAVGVLRQSPTSHSEHLIPSSTPTLVTSPSPQSGRAAPNADRLTDRLDRRTCLVPVRKAVATRVYARRQ